MSYSPKEKDRALGFHLILDCYECHPERLDNIDACCQYLDTLVERIGAIKQTRPYVFRTPEGLSGWVPIAESGISVHTLTESRFVSIDVYSCKEFDTETIIAFTRHFFGSGEIEHQLLLRGWRYHARGSSA